MHSLSTHKNTLLLPKILITKIPWVRERLQHFPTLEKSIGSITAQVNVPLHHNVAVQVMWIHETAGSANAPASLLETYVINSRKVVVYNSLNIHVICFTNCCTQAVNQWNTLKGQAGDPNSYSSSRTPTDCYWHISLITVFKRWKWLKSLKIMKRLKLYSRNYKSKEISYEICTINVTKAP
uniref:N-acetylmuramoyl-L-alanine amidase n=1 Tax=Heterorhabditis bacteriophora TaxID=37862 RepID=A0A1I7WV76_HETBA